MEDSPFFCCKSYSTVIYNYKANSKSGATEMDEIVHKNLKVNGINMHVAEIGKGPECVLFLHGFPELWGYGDTDVPPSAASYTVFNVVGDLVVLLDALGWRRSSWSDTTGPPLLDIHPYFAEFVVSKVLVGRTPLR
ncbi:UNVERIFIED_CONTAM: hypothetical protein Sradi_5270300 [Sesamum radiatum]|uniref:Epoxide hydrolase n=1 Tax=Sesamum radiatum TaxID=300843 RepID=A0AAW2LM43_SESRA